jgi:hypothetical protein
MTNRSVCEVLLWVAAGSCQSPPSPPALLRAVGVDTPGPGRHPRLPVDLATTPRDPTEPSLQPYAETS